LRDSPERVRTVTLVNPVSPYGFGGTKGAGGELVRPDGTGSGGGAVNPEFVQRLSKADRTVASQASPRQVFRTYYVKPPFRPAPEDEDRYVTAMLSTKVDDDHYPGDATVSEHWPYVAPGKRGVLNAMAPTYLRIDDLHTIDPKPPICWIRGSHDQIVADESIFDFAVLGTFGAIPGWPGAAEFPPQPMLVQTRAVLDRYAAAGGRYIETVIPDTGHSPQIERPMEFAAALRDSLAAG
jgi:pimeloyl-ACP methyl ester carboxylesterase